MSDNALTWAVAREAELREQSYREAMLWEKGVSDALALNPVFECINPEAQWIADMEAQFSVHADIVEQRALLRRFC